MSRRRRSPDRLRSIPLAVLLGLTCGLALGARAAGAGDATVRVAVSDEVEGETGLRGRLAPFAWIEVVEDAAALRVEVVGQGIAVRDAEGRSLVSPVPRSAPDLGKRVARDVTAWAHRILLGSLSNPASGLALDFRIEREGGSAGDGPVRVVEPGTELRWEARNRSQRPLWITVFAVSPDRGVSLVYPYRGRPEPLDPGDAVDQTGTVDLPEGARSATDRLVLFATSAPVDPAAFLEPERISEALDRLAGLDWRTAGHALSVQRTVAEIPEEPLVEPRETQEARAAGGAPRRPRARPRPRKLRFGVHFEPSPELGAVQRRVAKLATLCGRGGRACTVSRLFPEGGVFELERTGRRLGEGRSLTVASAFEQAYEIRRRLEAARVEPFLELERPGAQAGAPDEAASSAGSPAAPAPDDAWPLRHVRARQAWSELRRRRSRLEGREAEGIRVAHADTGYRRHPEVWDGDGDGSPIRVAAGRDYVDGDGDALDPMWAGSSEPAHGIASASVLASPSGCQLAGQPGCVHGIARGATLAPLRVQRAVSHFHSGRLARAIRDAAAGDLPEPVDVISLAMAGPPGWALWRAVVLAERQGLLVVAPAGDGLETVVWPARFPSTLAVSASRPGCGPWRASGRGPAVDVAAPGASVWRATVDPAGVPANAPGSGTAFAASATGAAAALWLARWQGDPRLARLRDEGRLTAGFRQALRETAWRPEARAPKDARCDAGVRWDPRFGPGILDAAALLARPPAGGAASPQLGLRDLPLFRSLYPGDAGERPVRDYRRLFGASAEVPLESLAYLEAEVLHHYAMAPEVTAALDALQGPEADEDAFSEARRALLRQGLSSDLREALRPASD